MNATTKGESWPTTKDLVNAAQELMAEKDLKEEKLELARRHVYYLRDAVKEHSKVPGNPITLIIVDSLVEALDELGRLEGEQ